MGGCILGECPVCGDLICEGEWDLAEDTMVHEQCKEQYFRQKYGMSEEQLQRLCGTQELRKQILDTEKELNKEMKYFQKELNVLKKRRDLLEKRNKYG